jgi:hypothetical protein
MPPPDTARLVDAGQRLAGQVIAFAIQTHQQWGHAGAFENCGSGSCRSSRRDLWRWEQAAGDEGHNWIAEQGAERGEIDG